MSNSGLGQARPAAPSFDLSGKRVVVVGGKKAIGLGVAEASHAMGAAVTVASRRKVSAELRPDLARFDQVVLDIRDEAAVQAANTIRPGFIDTDFWDALPPPTVEDIRAKACRAYCGRLWPMLPETWGCSQRLVNYLA